MAQSAPNYGWLRDDQAVEDVCTSLGGGVYGAGVSVGDDPLQGYARRQIGRGNHGVFPHLSGLSYSTKFDYAYLQQRGVCVGCGTARAIEDSWIHSIAQKGRYGRPVRVDVATIYAGSRTQSDLGNGRLGNSDGSVGAWAAKWVHDWGALEQKQVGSFDLRGLNESLAVRWGRRGEGVPRRVLDAIGDITITCFFCRSAEALLDAAYAGFGIAFCHNFTFGTKNADGVSRLSQRASHCTELLGAAVSAGGEPLIGGQQSWGNNRPGGPRQLRYRDGVVRLRPGMCFVPLGDFDKALRNGAEAWAFQVVEGWR